MPERRRRLAVGTELRPDVGHGRVVPDYLVPDEQVSDQRGHGLARGETEEEGVRGHLPPRRTVGDTGDGVDDLDTPVVDGDLQAGLGSGADAFVEDAPDPQLEGGHPGHPLGHV